ncbi:mCG145113, partial [Mus musculus]
NMQFGIIASLYSEGAQTSISENEILFHIDRSSWTSRPAPVESREGRRGNCKPRGIMPEEMPPVTQTECPMVSKTPHSNCTMSGCA